MHSKSALWFRLIVASAFGAWFWIVYFLADLATGGRTDLVHLDFAFEAAVPFLPWMSIFYLSITPLMLLAIPLIRDPIEFLALALTLASEVLVASLRAALRLISGSKLPLLITRASSSGCPTARPCTPTEVPPLLTLSDHRRNAGGRVLELELFGHIYFYKVKFNFYIINIISSLKYNYNFFLKNIHNI